jgi:hypothetical protein
MLSKRRLNGLVMSLILMILLFVGLQLALSGDSAKTWKDNSSGLIWSVKDNGSDMNWSQANNYCRNLALEGNRDWRLPTMKELETIYDKNSSKEFKAKNPIELTSENMWGESSGSEAWIFNFLNSSTSLMPIAGMCSAQGRALCVRQAK